MRSCSAQFGSLVKTKWGFPMTKWRYHGVNDEDMYIYIYIILYYIILYIYIYGHQWDN